MTDDYDDYDTDAASMGLDEDNADHALMLQRQYLHRELEPYAAFYQGAMSVVVAYYDNEDHPISALDSAESLAEECNSMADTLQRHVLDNHEHALRWTLDRSDELPHDPARL